MLYLRDGTLLCVILRLCMTELLPLTTGEGLPEHCTQTMVNREKWKSYDILLSRLNDSEFPEPPLESDDIDIEICPNTVLKFSWNMNRGQVLAGTEMKLCYRMKAIFNGYLLRSICVRFHVQSSSRRIQMTCRFPMFNGSSRPIIHVSATSLDNGNQLFYYGELNTAGSDATDSCKRMCDIRVIKMNAVISCNAKSSIVYKDSISIVRLSFDPINSKSCGDSSVQISKQTSNHLDYYINCPHKGRGVVKVLYNIQGFICYKTRTVRVICDTVSTTTTFLATTESAVDKIQSFLIFGISCLVIAVVIIYTVALRLKQRLIDNRRVNGDDVYRTGSEIILSQNNNSRFIEDNGSSSSGIVTTSL